MYFGGIECSLGKYEKSEELYNKSLKIFENTYGEDHPECAQTRNSLGLFFPPIFFSHYFSLFS